MRIKSCRRAPRTNSRKFVAERSSGSCWNSALLSESKHSRCPESASLRETTSGCEILTLLIAVAQVLQRAQRWRYGNTVCVCASILAKNVGHSVGRSRRLAPVGLTLSKVTSRARTQDAGSGRGLAQSRVPCWSAVSGSRLADGPLRTSVSDPAATLRPASIAARRMARERNRMPGSTLAAFLRRRRTSRSSPLTSSVRTSLGLFHLNRAADVDRVILFVS